MLSAQSTTKDYIRAEYKFHSISKFFISQVIIPQVMLFEPIYSPQALNTGTCLQQGDLFYSAGLHRNHELATANTGEIGRGLGKKCSWMDLKGRNKHSMYGYILTYSRLYGVVPKGLLTFLGSLYKEVAKTTPETLVYRFETQPARKKKKFLPSKNTVFST